MVGPPSENINSDGGFFISAQPSEANMTKGDPANILVFCIIIAFVSFVVYAAVQGRIEEKKSKNKDEGKK